MKDPGIRGRDLWQSKMLCVATGPGHHDHDECSWSEQRPGKRSDVWLVTVDRNGIAWTWCTG